MATQFATIPRVAVLGGGITGLAAAYRLRELAAAHETPLDTTLFESAARVGGALETIRAVPYVIETGADSILSEKPAGLKLVQRLALESELIGTREHFRRVYVVRKGRLVPIPDGFAMMAPALWGPVLRSPLFSPLGKLRMLAEQVIPRRRSHKDESLASFVARRLGRQVLDRVAQPLAGGIYTADPTQLSVAATMPRFVEMERRYGSLVRGLRSAARNRATAGGGQRGVRWSQFVSFKNGISELTDTLAMRLGNSIRYGACVTALERQQPTERPRRRAWRLRLENDLSVEADAVICTIPAYAAAPLLRPHSTALADKLDAIDYASAATVNLALRESDLAGAPQCFGFVVPAIERRRIVAASFSSFKYEGRAPGGMVLARAFIGGALQKELTELEDSELIAVAQNEFADLLGIKPGALLTYVRRWPRSMPQYAVGHLEHTALIEHEASAIQNFALAGAFLRGVGIPDCIHAGESAADRIFSHLTMTTGPTAGVDAAQRAK
jgi:protoporphyrinogen/coproporphyrinogen III oxidase